MEPAHDKTTASNAINDLVVATESVTLSQTPEEQTGSDAEPRRSRSTSRHSSRRSSRRPSRKNSTLYETKHSLNHPRVASYAFAFDIDGVLVKGPETIPEAPLALQMLNGDNKYNIKVPYIFVTNGGGKTEELRCEDLSQRLGVPVKPDQFIQGHTPMKDLASKYETVLVVGGTGEACRIVAENYGFKDVVTPGDILKWNPNVSPFRTLTEEEYNNSRTIDFSKVSIGAILVFADSREWASDQQIILDLLMSKNGVMGTISETFEEGPSLYFAHNDFVWATNYNLSRYGMGALQVSIAALYEAHTGKKLTRVTKYGKPNQATFKYARKVLTDWRQETYETHVSSEDNSTYPSDTDEPGTNNSSSTDLRQAATKLAAVTNPEAEEEHEIEEPLEPIDLLPAASTVYFVGDTPESDIRFANTFDKTWYSILVKTGVYQEGTTPKYTPKKIVNNVLEAVIYAIEREHEKELKLYHQAVDQQIEVPVEKVEELHPHMLEEAIKRRMSQDAPIKLKPLTPVVTNDGSSGVPSFGSMKDAVEKAEKKSAN